MFLAWVKNKEEGKAMELRDKFVAELEKIDKFLGNGPGEAQLGLSWTTLKAACRYKTLP